MDKGLIKIIKSGNISIPLYLLKNYKRLDIKLEEFVFLMYLYNKGNKFLFDPQMFSEELNIKSNDTMKYIGILTDKGLINVEVIKNDKGYMEEVVILDEFYSKMSLIVMEDVNESRTDIDNTSIFDAIEREFGRTLSPIEIEIIKGWLENNFSEELIKEALKEATFNGVSNLRYIDKILYEWSKKGIKSASDVAENRKKRKKIKEKKEETEDIDLDTLEWNWFDDE